MEKPEFLPFPVLLDSLFPVLRAVTDSGGAREWRWGRTAVPLWLFLHGCGTLCIHLEHSPFLKMKTKYLKTANSMQFSSNFQECIAHILFLFYFIFLIWKALWKYKFPLSQVICDPQVWQIHLYFAEKDFHTLFLTVDFLLNWAALEGEDSKEAEPGGSPQRGLPLFY